MFYHYRDSENLKSRKTIKAIDTGNGYKAMYAEGADPQCGECGHYGPRKVKGKQIARCKCGKEYKIVNAPEIDVEL